MTVSAVTEASNYLDEELTKLILAGLNNGVGLSRVLTTGYKIDLGNKINW